MYVWECVGGEHGAFENPVGNNACLGILIETMYVCGSFGNNYVWESQEKQCTFCNPLGNIVCLGTPGETMCVLEPLGEQCAFGNHL